MNATKIPIFASMVTVLILTVPLLVNVMKDFVYHLILCCATMKTNVPKMSTCVTQMLNVQMKLAPTHVTVLSDLSEMELIATILTNVKLGA